MNNIHLTEKQICVYLESIDKSLKKKDYKIYEHTPNFNSSDRIAVNKEARKMLDFVGLNGYIAVITYTQTSKNEGGNVELDNSNEVFIEISSDMIYDKDRVLAVMAHEICHKVLYVNGLYYRPPIPKIENEKLTDLATIYVGFGKLTLNGCYKEYTTETKQHNSIIKTVHKETTGYLSLDTFALAFNIVSARFGVNHDVNGLSSFAINALHRNSSPFFEKVSPTLLKETLKKVQEVDAEELAIIVSIEDIIRQIRSKVQNRHNQYFLDFINPFDLSKDELVNQFPAIAAYHKYNFEIREYDKTEVNVLSNILSILGKQFGIDYNSLLKIECPHCGYTKDKALKEPKQTFLKCPHCGYFFSWNSYEILNTISKGNEEKGGNSFWKKLKSKYKK